MFLRSIIDRLTGNYSAVNRSFGDEIEAERFGMYGLFSRPKKGTETVLLRRGDSIIIVGERDQRISIELLDGEVALYDGVNRVHLQGEKGIVIDAPAGVKIGSSGTQKLLTEIFAEWADTHFHADNGLPPTVLSSTIQGIKTTLTEAV